MMRRLAFAIVLSICAGASAGSAQERPRERLRAERAEDLPRHTYRVASTARGLLEDTAQFNALARQLETDVRSDLSSYIIMDRARLKQYYGILSHLALVRGEDDAAVAWQDSIRAIEDKPAQRLLTGIVERPFAAANRAPHDRFEEAFREAFRREVSALPYAEVRSELAMIREGQQLAGSPSMAAYARRTVEEQVRDGFLSLTGAQNLLRLRVSELLRARHVSEAIVSVLTDVMAADSAGKADIWAARDVSLDGRTGLTPVTVAIWDSGVDVDLFPGRLFVNAREVAGNGRDDDGNGHVDDVHGIAYDLNHDRSTGVLAPITLSAAQQAEYRQHGKGASDLAGGVQSAEAQAFRQKLASTPPAEMGLWFEGRALYNDYIHGTHVAGIAMRGNPAARLLVARNEEDNWKPVPQLVTLEGERKRANEYIETVEYFKRNGVRVVNMSWAYTPNYYQDILGRNQAGGDADGRRRLAREMFDIAATALHKALESAPEILFVTIAGNQNDDSRFVERIPSTFQLPNLMTVAAVDHAGDEAPFTSYGKVDVHANGSHIASVAPGGEIVPVSGTSMAAPQIVNLAGKLLALKPNLTVAELRRAIEDAADEKRIAEGKTIRLLNPKASVGRILAAGGR